MSHQIELPDSIYNALENAASASGTTPVGWIAARLPSVSTTTKVHAGTLADLFSGRLGRIASGGKEVLSERCGEKLADYLEEQRARGRL